MDHRLLFRSLLQVILVPMLLAAGTACAQNPATVAQNATAPAQNPATVAQNPAAPTQNPGAFSRTVGPIFAAKCTSCHGGQKAEAGLRLDSWAGVMAGSRFGDVVIAHDAKRSLLARLVAGQETLDAHPGNLGERNVDDDELQAIWTWISEGAPNDDGELPFAGDRDFVYVCNQGEASVSVIDAEAGVVARVVDFRKLGFAENAKPHHIVVEPDGFHWYVSLIGAGRVLKLNRDNEIVAFAETPYPGLLALDPNGDWLYVGRSMTAVSPPQTVARIRRSDMTVAEEVEVFFTRPHALALSPDGRAVYAASLAENRMAAVDLSTGDATLLGLDGPIHTIVQFAVSPKDGTVVGGGQLTGTLFVVEPASQAGPARIVKTFEGPAAPWLLAFDAIGDRLYVPNKNAQRITVYDPADWSVAATVEGDGIADPEGIVFSQDGRFLFVSNTNMHNGYTPRYDFGPGEDHSGMHLMPGMHGFATRPGTVTKIEVATGQIVKVIEIGMAPTGIGSRGPARAPRG